MQIGEELKKRRIKLGWSQQDLSNESKVHRHTIAKIERNNQNVNLESLAKCFDAMDRVLNLKVSVKK